MQTRTERRTTVTLPSLDEEYLSEVDNLDESRLEDFSYADAELRELDLAGTHLIDGRITGLASQRTSWRMLRVDSVELSRCDLASLRWAESKVSRVTFTDCKLMGGTLEGITLDNVVFDNCRLDFTTFTHVRATGPVIFTRCSLREAAFTAPDLSGALFDGCDLYLTEFGGGTYRGCDLRGNDLSTIRGVGSLRQVIVDRQQSPQLADALTSELEITFAEDLDT